MGHNSVQQKAQDPAFTTILPSPHQINAGGSGTATGNMTWINIAMHWGKGVSFSPESDKVSQPFFQDCSSI